MELWDTWYRLVKPKILSHQHHHYCREFPHHEPKIFLYKAHSSLKRRHHCYLKNVMGHSRRDTNEQICVDILQFMNNGFRVLRCVSFDCLHIHLDENELNWWVWCCLQIIMIVLRYPKNKIKTALTILCFNYRANLIL